MNVTRKDVISLIASIIKDNENKSRNEHYRLFHDKVLESENSEYVDAIISMIFSLHYNTTYSSVFPDPIIYDRDDKKLSKEQYEQYMYENEQDELKEKEAYKIHIINNLMDFILPTGKTLRYSTGMECIKAGGFLTVIGKTVGEKNVVGEKLNEIDLQELYKSNNNKRYSRNATEIRTDRSFTKVIT